ncbi:MAG: hypothetical protein AAF390_10140, partial [Pseudomonadota bacterium]
MRAIRFTNAYVTATCAALGLCLLYVWLRLGHDYLSGGNAWKQGDWLINSSMVEVRRALAGDLILVLSDLTGVGPLGVAVALQGLIFALLGVFLLVVLRRVSAAPLMCFLLITPAFFPLFWTSDPQGGMRKEMLIYAGFSFLVYAALWPRLRGLLLGASVVFFSLGVFAHEAMVLFLPAYGICLLALNRAGHLTRAGTATLGALAAAVCGASLLLVMQVQTTVPDPRMICAPLIERGLSPEICSGAIAWLEIGFAENSAVIAFRTAGDTLPKLVLSYALSIGALFFFLWHSDATRRLYGLVLLLATRQLALVRAPRLGLLALVSASYLFWGIAHVELFRLNGPVQE